MVIITDLTLSYDVLVVELEVDVQLIFQMTPKTKAFLSKQMLHDNSIISISANSKAAVERTYMKSIHNIKSKKKKPSFKNENIYKLLGL